MEKHCPECGAEFEEGAYCAKCGSELEHKSGDAESNDDEKGAVIETEEIKRKCNSCKEPVSIDAVKCPHCASRQLTSRTSIIGLTIMGVLGLPFSYVAIPLAWSYGIPNGLIDGLSSGFVWAIGLFGPLFLLIALGSYVERREAIQNARGDQTG